MKRDLTHLASTDFDLCIIGGGASGAGLALDASLRGLKVCLIEGGDFASDTSSKSTKLIHGGVRYLEQAFMKLDFGQLRQVKHGMQERHFLLENAPHLSRPLGLITPVFSWFEAVYYSIGLKIYGLFASKSSVPSANWLNKKNTLALMPSLSQNMHSSVLYFDGQFNDSRFTVSLAKTAFETGVSTATYLKAIDFEKDQTGKICSVNVKDQIGNGAFAIKAKVFVNATGAHADVLRKKANPNAEERIRPSKGVHLVLAKDTMPGKHALLIPKTKDGRVVFVIPFEDRIMVGTTDTDYHGTEEPKLEAEEVDYLLETMNRYVEKPLSKDKILAGFGGLRPLVSGKGNSQTKSLLRDHEIELDTESGLVSILGGKWTTYRLIAKDAADMVADILKLKTTCTTDAKKLVGAEEEPKDLKASLETDIIEHLKQTYGCRYQKIIERIELEPSLQMRVLPAYPYIMAEIGYLVAEEMAMKPRDILARRWRLEIQSWVDCQSAIEPVALEMAKYLQWTPEELKRNKEDYYAQIEHFKNTI